MKNKFLLRLTLPFLGFVASPIHAQEQASTIEAPASFVAQESSSRIEGVLFEKGTKKPLADINVFVLPAKLKATTDASGKFVIEKVPAGEFNFIVNATGYLKLEKRETLASGVTLKRTLYLERASYQGLETTVVGKVAKRDESVRTMKTEEFLTLPGSGGDPVKAVQNLPGVARTGFSSQVIIQGSAPRDTSYALDEHNVPLVFHFGGLTSIITPEAVDAVDYLAAGYGPEFGLAMGGIVGLRTKDPATDRQKGFVFMDTTKAGGLIEGPIDETSSYLVTGRYSYLGLVLAAALKDNPRFDLTVAPSFADLTAIYKRKINDRDTFRILAIGSRDELKFLFKEPLREEPSIRGNFSNETIFYRVIPQWTRSFDDSKKGRLSLGMGQNILKVDAGENFFDLQSIVVSQRGEYEWKPREDWTSYLGVDNQYIRSTVNLRLPTPTGGGGIGNPISSGSTTDLSITRDDFLIGPYWRNTIKGKDSKWTLMPSLRIDYINFTKEILPQPRFAARYDHDDSLFYKAAGGLYFQPPEFQESSPEFGNPDVKSPHSWHYTVGAEKDLRAGSTDGWVVSSNLFYRQFEKLVVASSRTITRDGSTVPERFTNEGRGRAFGAEFMIKYDAKRWSGWLAYTVSRSLRTEPGQAEYVYAYDQTHNINLVGSYDLPRNWKLSGRVRYVTGNPNTPVIGGTFDSDNDTYVPQRGPFFSERLEPFFQVDFRADKKWVYDTWILWGYLDIQNVTNQQNPEGIRYAYDYSQRRTVTGLPILPTIGVRGEF